MKPTHILTSTTLVVFLLSAIAVAQQKDRVLKQKNWRGEPLKILKLKVKGKQVKFNQEVVTDDDWFRGLTVEVKNVSDQAIIFIDLGLIFPASEGATQEQATRDHLLYGHYPPPPGQMGSLHPDQPPLQPGGAATLVLSDYEGTRDFLNRVGKPQSIKEIQISIDEVVFAHGKKWRMGEFMERDPNDPDSWIPVLGMGLCS